MAECAVLYARVSTAMQGEGYSLSTQLESGRRYAVIHGYRIVGEYCDQGSGELLHRPQLDELLARAHSDPFQVVVVHDLDRFTRNPSHLAILEMELEQTGARVEFVLGDYTALCVNIERDTFDAELSVESGRRRIKNCHTIKQ